jgi:hypothetical protein
MVTHWKPSIEIWRSFPFFLFSLVAIETNFFRIYIYICIFISIFGEITPSDGYTQKPNIEIWRVFPFFFSLTCGDWNQLLSNIFIFLYFDFWRDFARKRTAPSPTHKRTYLSSLVSRLVRVGRDTEQVHLREREREREPIVFLCLCARVCVCVVAWTDGLTSAPRSLRGLVCGFRAAAHGGAATKPIRRRSRRSSSSGAATEEAAAAAATGNERNPSKRGTSAAARPWRNTSNSSSRSSSSSSTDAHFLSHRSQDQMVCIWC